MARFKKVFLIDDDEIFLLVSKAIMEEEDFCEEIHSFMDPMEAIEYFKVHQPELEFPDIIFLDINMPMLDGWEFIHLLEQMGISRHLKIFITSSSINPRDLEMAEKNPLIHSFVDKPFSPAKLRDIAEKIG